ncbi:hypothetical protein Q4R64_11145 [Morganella morganii]|uniref:hypothetical protein n=1 Tax=Morganella sp. HMSC11D09 TaxID=1581087 RepID=UPI0008A3A3B6|nr:hypothetical protein [Morganella sp. HMSC11D09]OFV04416.1 hypothetical protein HMPREF3119_00440 [Morganella sp. HMSC11D09]HBN5713643.1 hypothetical protein [Morganella morganii]
MDDKAKENDAKLRNLFYQVTEDRLLKFLKAVGVDEVKCQICGNIHMAIPNVADDDGKPYLIPIDTDEVVSYKNKYWVTNYKYRLICMNCGHEIYFNAWPITDWLADQDKEPGNEGE